MSINSFITRFFGREEAENSKNMAKERLRLVLVHDRLDFSEHMMNSLRVDLLNVIGKYFGIDEQALEVSLSRESSGMALVANIPIRRHISDAADDQSAPAEKAETAKKPKAPERAAGKGKSTGTG